MLCLAALVVITGGAIWMIVLLRGSDVPHRKFFEGWKNVFEAWRDARDLGEKTVIILLILRQGLRLYLEIQGGVSVVGEASEGFEALALVEQLQPDLLILDIKMPGLDGLEVAQRITKGPWQTRIIMLSMYSNEAYVVQALRAGAAGYVTKESSGSELMTAMRDVMNGHHYLSPALSERAIELYKKTAAPSEFGLYETLTNREREVL
ncbi:MAG: response regulator transcription factor, partial [Gemmatimonadetes bacterium]|nr:response regulator transcription factor [Gemmatimonadota bacterium]